MMTLTEKNERLRDWIRACGRLAVAFSGGVDSSFLLKTAQEVLGEGARAFIVRSVFIPVREFEDAVSFCETHGIAYTVLEADVLAIPEVKGNPVDRCYYCKRNLFTMMLDAASSMGFSVLADGTNADDTGDYRPGMRALRELGVRSPLMESGLTKAEIRALSRNMGLPCWDKPSAACLASRVTYGESLTAEKLKSVEEAESLLHSFGVRQCRVRVHGNSARIEVLPEDFEVIITEQNRRKICEKLKESGYTYVSLDLEGFRSGSMNEIRKTTV